MLLSLLGNADGDLTVGANRAAHHPVAIENHGHVALTIKADDSPFPVLCDEFFHDHIVGGFLERYVEISYARTDIGGDHVAYEKLADSGRGNRATVVVGVSARTNERGIAVDLLFSSSAFRSR